MSSTLNLRMDAGVATVEFNRPDAYNSLNVEMLDSLPILLRELGKDDDVRCIVITGAGNKAFCAGGDISGLVDGNNTPDHSGLVKKLETWGQSSLLLHEMPKPTLAVVNGAAAGAGMALALACDLRIASYSAHFTTAFSKLAMSGDFGGSYFLTRIVGTAKARELYFLSDRIDSETASNLGLVNWRVSDDLLAGKAAAISARLAALPPLTARYIKQNLSDSLHKSASEIIRQESSSMIETAMSKETQQAAMAFFSSSRN